MDFTSAFLTLSAALGLVGMLILVVGAIGIEVLGLDGPDHGPVRAERAAAPAEARR